jgi:ribonuclease III
MRDVLRKLIGFEVLQPETYVAALTHKSRQRCESLNYERLEFLGDAVINLIGARYLFTKYPDAEVGQLTQMRSRIVSGKCLSSLARHIDLPSYLRMSKRALEKGVNHRDRVCEDALEALVGAIYVDMGMAACERFFIKLMEETGSDSKAEIDTNFKDQLSRMVTSMTKTTPLYTTVSDEVGFRATCYVGDTAVGLGLGVTKKEAEQKAAQTAFDALLATGHSTGYTGPCPMMA